MSGFRKLLSAQFFTDISSFRPRLFCTAVNSSETAVSDEDKSESKELQNPLSRTLIFPDPYYKPKEVWVENMDSIKEVKKGIVQLHPKIFATMPRLDLISENVNWQKWYRKVNTLNAKSRAEMHGTNRKPWPQKGTGRARQGSRRAPHFVHGGKAHGPRDPTTWYYMLPDQVRIMGLTSSLSVKFAQNDIRVVENLDIPSEDSSYIVDLMKERHWGVSVLFVDTVDIMPRNITLATEPLGHVNLMPAYGLNCYSMLKHHTLVLTLDAVNQIETSLLTLLNTCNSRVFYKNNQLHRIA